MNRQEFIKILSALLSLSEVKATFGDYKPINTKRTCKFRYPFITSNEQVLYSTAVAIVEGTDGFLDYSKPFQIKIVFQSGYDKTRAIFITQFK